MFKEKLRRNKKILGDVKKINRQLSKEVKERMENIIVWEYIV